MAALAPLRFVEVDRRNFEAEFERMKMFVPHFNIVTIDTEFAATKHNTRGKGQSTYNAMMNTVFIPFMLGVLILISSWFRTNLTHIPFL